MPDQTRTGGGSGGTSPWLVLVFALVAFVSLVIFGFGMASLFSGEDVIAAPGLGPLPGAVGVTSAAVAFALMLLPALRGAHPTYFAALWVAAAAFLAYLAGLWLAAVIGGADTAVASAVVGRLVVGGWAPLLAAAAFVCAWGAVAVRRTKANPPRWPWEKDEQ